jgi:Protein of unknown function (DUF3352)
LLVSTHLPPGSPGGPEYLESGAGGPLRQSASGTGRRTALIAGGVVGVVALGAAGAWAWSFFSTGAQPAEALPDSTIAYASIDLDPSGGQKIEAMRTLRKFPAFKDKVGLDTDDDVRKRIFEELQDDAGCEGLDYAEDIEPWLGHRMAVAAVDGGEDPPTPVFVLQVTDEDAADAGLEKVKGCGGDSGAWAINDGWALVGETQEKVDRIANDAADAPLSDDDDYASWTDEAGDVGIATAYVAPEAGQILVDNLDQMTSPLGESGEGDGGSDSLVPPEYAKALQNFKGMAATVRFDDGSLELEVAADAGTGQQVLTDRGDDVLSTLPADTAMAIGVGFADGWFGDLVDQMASFDQEMSADELMSQLSEEVGLDLPGDVETLTGESAALAIGGDFDPEALFDFRDSTDVPVGLKVQGDPDAIESVLDKLRPQLGRPAESLLGSDAEGDVIAIGPDEGYRARLLEHGDLGGSDVFQNVVREADGAAAILFVNFDATGGWLSEVNGDDPEAAENLAPLQGLGLSTWLDGDTSRLVLRITTD